MDLEALIGAPVQTRIKLGCAGGKAGFFINNRWLELPCRHKQCKQEGVLTFHVWDTLTGRVSTTYKSINPPVGDTPKEQTPNGTL